MRCSCTAICSLSLSLSLSLSFSLCADNVLVILCRRRLMETWKLLIYARGLLAFCGRLKQASAINFSLAKKLHIGRSPSVFCSLVVCLHVCVHFVSVHYNTYIQEKSCRISKIVIFRTSFFIMSIDEESVLFNGLVPSYIRYMLVPASVVFRTTLVNFCSLC